MNTQTLITQALSPYPGLFDRLERLITPERAFACFKLIADTYAPTLTVRYTRGPVIKALLDEAKSQGWCGPNVTFRRNYLSTGNVALEFGTQPRKPVWAMAHLDIISFLTGSRQGNRYKVTPFCEPRQSNGVREALALAFSAETGGLVELARGRLISEDNGKSNFFETGTPDLPLATRVVYASEAEWDRASGMVYGTVDDAFGCAALVMAAMALSHYSAEALIILTDEEEGVVAPGNRAFSRASTRLLNRIAPERLPDLITITDLHEDVADLFAGNFNTGRFGQGALFAAFASGAKGGVTPPHLLSFQRELAGYLGEHHISLQENPGYVSRSDCVSAMLATPNVSLIGFPGAYSHFADTPRAHISDLVSLAKVMAVYILVAQHAAWRELYLL
jgi:hypothetical protein